MIDKIKERLENQYNLNLNLNDELMRSIESSPAWFAEVLLKKEMANQNRSILERMVNEVRTVIYEDIIDNVNKRLRITNDQRPDIFLNWEAGNSHICFNPVGINGQIRLSPIAIMEYRGNNLGIKELTHEYGHVLSYVYNPLSLEEPNKIHKKFSGHYGKGLFLDDTVHQVEGFATWLMGQNDHLIDTYEKYTIEDDKARLVSMWEHLKFRRRIFDNPYSFGALVFDLVNRVYGAEGIKKLAFDNAKTRKDIIEAYIDCCAKLGLESNLPKQRHKRLNDTYEEMLICGVLKKNSELEKKVYHIDKEIERLENSKQEPLIIADHTDGSTISEILVENYWHHGLFTFNSRLSDEQRNIDNILFQDVISAILKILYSSWNIYINSSYKHDSEDISKIKNSGKFYINLKL